jgi:hypothetical protein
LTFDWRDVLTTKAESRDLDLAIATARQMVRDDKEADGLLTRIIGFVWWSHFPTLVWTSC